MERTVESSSRGKWSNLHDERLAWWRKKAKEIGVQEEGHWISEVAKRIHPTGKKPCQLVVENYY